MYRKVIRKTGGDERKTKSDKSISGLNKNCLGRWKTREEVARSRINRIGGGGGGDVKDKRWKLVVRVACETSGEG